MDQQCTVTRPGLSYLASAYAVELLVGLLQLDDCCFKTEPLPNARGRLGRIPHQIRGNLVNQETFTLIGSAFENCTCCSDRILKEYREKGFEFIKMACNSPNELEKVSGLTELKDISNDLSNLCISASDFSDIEGGSDNE